MSRHFSIRTVLRSTPNVLLREFFDRLQHRLLCLDWQRLAEHQIEPIVTAMNWLPPPARDQVEAALAAVFDLACHTGVQAMLEAARLQGSADVVRQFPENASPYEAAMWCWLRWPEVFEQARFLHQVDTLTRWRKRQGLPRVEPRTAAEATHELATALSQFLRREELRGQQCTVEHCHRDDGTDYFVAYPDDFVRTVFMHDEQGQLVARPIRQTFEIVFAYHGGEGMLELFAKIPSSMKPKLEGLFGQIILGADIGPQCHGLPYDLNRLKDRYFCLETDPADGVLASVCKLRLDVPQEGQVTVAPFQQDPGRDVYKMIDHCLNREKVRWEEVNISQATMCFEFQRQGRRRAGALVFEVTHPDHCNVRSRRPEQIDLTRKYLKRWRIARV